MPAMLAGAADSLRARGLSAGAAMLAGMTDTSAGVPADADGKGGGAVGGADESRKLTMTETSAAATDLGWRYILGWLCTSVPAASLAEAAGLATRATAAAGPDADAALSADVRHDGVLLALQDRAAAAVTVRETRLAGQITAALRDAGYATGPATGGTAPRSVQMLELAIDAVDIPSIRPFWKAVFGYTSEPGYDGPEDALIDPAGQGPAIWFQQMDTPRPQRNRIHFDISVPHDEAKTRLDAALAAGGRLLSDDEAPAFWVLADAEGNEACICTWQGRD
jgi:4a-hydroxytetrahydrobiopterin dehydratase